MSLKRSYTASYGGQGYDDNTSTVKRVATGWSAPVTGDFRTGGRGQAQYDYGQGGHSMSFESASPPQIGMVGDHGVGMPLATDRFTATSGLAPEPDHSAYNYGYPQSGGYDIGTGYDQGGGGYTQHADYTQGRGAYSAGGRNDQTYGFDNHSYENQQQQDWSYEQSSNLTWFGGRGQGQGYSQFKGVDRGGWTPRGVMGRGNQTQGQARGRGQVGGRGQGQGQAGSRGRGQAFSFGSPGSRSLGRGQINANKQRGRGFRNFGISSENLGSGIGNFGNSSGNFGYSSGNFGSSGGNFGYSRNFDNGGGNFGSSGGNFGSGSGNFGSDIGFGGFGAYGSSSYEEQNSIFSFIQQQQNQGYNFTGRGQWSRGGHGLGQWAQGFNRGRKIGRGRGGGGLGRGATASQVKSISENIMSMVTKGQTGGQGKGKGQAGCGRGGAGSKPSSFMDMVDTARQRRFGGASAKDSEEANRLAQFLAFFATCPDRVNGIQTIGNALTASRLNLQVEFEAEELMYVTKPLFTGVLRIGGFFFTRGLGLSKKAVKHDCFQRAIEMLRTMNVDDIQKLEDCGKEALKEEVQRQSTADFESFKSFLCKKQNSTSMSETTSQMPGIKQGSKKQQKQAAEMETSEKIKTAAVSESQVAERNFPLSDKMMMLVKEIEKLSPEETSDVAMASRFDVLCFKMGISVAALFRAVSPSQARQFNTQPFKGDPNVDLICEIFYDGVQVGQGQGKPRKEAQVAAYSNIRSRLTSEPISQIVQGPKLHTQPESLPDYFEVIYKGAKPQEGNNHQRLFSLRAFPPDLNKPVDDMVIIEMQGESIEENAYKILEFSASRNGMLLEWKQLDKTASADGFRCEISLNNQKTVVGMAQSKPKSRNAAAAMILMEMYQSQDVVCFSTKDDFAKAVPFSDLVKRAEELKAEGPARTDRVDCVWPEHSTRTSESEPDPNRDEVIASSQDWKNDPLRLWIEDAIVEKMEAYQKKVTLEELTFGPGVSGGMRKFCYAAARTYLLSAPSMRLNINKEMFLVFHHRGVTPQEIVKILHVCKRSSGRYKLVRANKPLSVTQQAQFVRTFPEECLARARAQQEAEKQKKETEAAGKMESSDR